MIVSCKYKEQLGLNNTKSMAIELVALGSATFGKNCVYIIGDSRGGVQGGNTRDQGGTTPIKWVLGI